MTPSMQYAVCLNSNTSLKKVAHARGMSMRMTLTCLCITVKLCFGDHADCDDDDDDDDDSDDGDGDDDDDDDDDDEDDNDEGLINMLKELKSPQKDSAAWCSLSDKLQMAEVSFSSTIII